MTQCQESVRGEVDNPEEPCIIILEDDDDEEGPSTAVLMDKDPQEEAERDQMMTPSFTTIRPNEENSSKTEKDDSKMDQT